MINTQLNKPLTNLESQVHPYLKLGFTNTEIADVLLMSRDSVSRHVRAIIKKLGIKAREEITEARE